MISPVVFLRQTRPVMVVQQELFMLSASQEIYSRRVRLAFFGTVESCSTASMEDWQTDYWSILTVRLFAPRTHLTLPSVSLTPFRETVDRPCQSFFLH